MVEELGRWLRRPRTNAEIREHLHARYDGGRDGLGADLVRACNVLLLVQLPPAGHWNDPRRSSFVVDQRPLPSEQDAAALVVERYLAAFGPASRRDMASWAGAAQRDFAAGLERLTTVTYRDEKDVEPSTCRTRRCRRWSRSCPCASSRAGSSPCSPTRTATASFRRSCSRSWLTLSGDQTITVDGRVAASWKLDRSARLTRVRVIPHRDILRRAHAQIRAEARRTARFCEPGVDKVEVAGL